MCVASWHAWRCLLSVARIPLHNPVLLTLLRIIAALYPLVQAKGKDCIFLALYRCCNGVPRRQKQVREKENIETESNLDGFQAHKALT